MLFITIALLIMVLILTIGMTSLQDRWLLPASCSSCRSVLLENAGRRAAADSHLRRFLVVPLVLMIAIPAALLVRPNLPTLFKGYGCYGVPIAALPQRYRPKRTRHPA